MLNKLIPVIFVLLLLSNLAAQENPLIAPGNNDISGTQYTGNAFADTNLVVQGIWSRLGNLPKSLLGVNTYYDSLSNKIFICGGLDQNSVPNDTCWWYDIASATYQQAAYLPSGRWSGKLVKVKNNLYLIGSINSSFSNPDGIIYKYSLQQNNWVTADTMPLPLVHESAVCVFKDSLIIVIGGSSNGFQQPRNFVRIYNPALNTWKNSSLFPINITTAHSEINITANDTSVFVTGGYSSGNLNTVYRGSVNTTNPDTISIGWVLFGNAPFNQPVYRVAGTKWNSYMLFGPAMNVGVSISSIWGLTYSDGTGVWTSFTPAASDTAGIISTFSAVNAIDSNYFYLFGGYNNLNTLNTAQKFSFITPPPIGIINLSQVPKGFKLYQNYPNPFNPVTRIRIDIAYSSLLNMEKTAELKIFDILGRVTARYVFTNLNPGSYQIDFDGSNLASGIYFYKFTNGVNTDTKRMILLK